MAECLRERVQNITECIVCLERFNKEVEPKVLFCGHQVCKICLDAILETGSLNTDIECPECKQVTRLPDGGVSDLPTSFSILGLAEKLEEINFDDKPADENLRKCQDCMQPVETGESFCSTCRVTLCLACFSEKHSSHIPSTVERDFLELCRTLSEKRAIVDEQISKETEKLEQIESCTIHVEENKNEVRQRIQLDADKLVKHVENMQKAFLEEVELTFEKQLEELQQAKQEIEGNREKMENDLNISQILSREILNGTNMDTVLKEWQNDLVEMLDRIIVYGEKTNTLLPEAVEREITYKKLTDSSKLKFGHLKITARRSPVQPHLQQLAEAGAPPPSAKEHLLSVAVCKAAAAKTAARFAAEAVVAAKEATGTVAAAKVKLEAAAAAEAAKAVAAVIEVAVVTLAEAVPSAAAMDAAPPDVAAELAGAAGVTAVIAAGAAVAAATVAAAVAKVAVEKSLASPPPAASLAVELAAATTAGAAKLAAEAEETATAAAAEMSSGATTGLDGLVAEAQGPSLSLVPPPPAALVAAAVELAKTAKTAAQAAVRVTEAEAEAEKEAAIVTQFLAKKKKDAADKSEVGEETQSAAATAAELLRMVQVQAADLVETEIPAVLLAAAAAAVAEATAELAAGAQSAAAAQALAQAATEIAALEEEDEHTLSSKDDTRFMWAVATACESCILL